MYSPKFPLGIIVHSPGVIAKVNLEDAYDSLCRHEAADWEDQCADDRRDNQTALACGLRIWSTYRDRNNVRYWIITEADRSYTTLKLPVEY